MAEQTHDYECDDCGEMYQDETKKPTECDECYGTSFTKIDILEEDLDEDEDDE